jgi:hypothetical protein
MKTITHAAAILLLTGLGFVAGCGVSEAEVSGAVNVDGKPLKEGDIIFEERDKSKTPAAGKIVEGKYTLRVLPGSKTVRISASRPTKKPDPLLGSAAREPMILPEFNERSTLTKDIKPGKQDGVNFEVKSIP